MKKLLTFLFVALITLTALPGFSQFVTVTIGGTGGVVTTLGRFSAYRTSTLNNGSNNPIIWETVEISANISNTATTNGRVALIANKVYKISFGVRQVPTVSNFGAWQLFDETNGVFIGERAIAASVNQANDNTSHPDFAFIFKPAGDIEISVKDNGGVIFAISRGSYFVVQELPSTSAVSLTAPSAVSNNIFLTLAAQQNAINANTVIELRDDAAGAVNNGITYNNTTFRATLLSGNTYKLKGYIRHLGSTNNTAAGYKWFDVTNATFIGVENQVQSQNAAGNDGVQPVASAIITPTTDIEVEFRCQGVSVPNQSISVGSTYGIIETITSGARAVHALGGAQHSSDILANLNSRVSDNTLLGISGVVGGQTIIGGTLTGNALTLESNTLNDGKILLGANSAYNESNNVLSIGTIIPDATAQLDIVSTTRGLLPPRLTTTQRDAITSPANGLLIFNSTSDKYNFRKQTKWKQFVFTPTQTLSSIGAFPFVIADGEIEGDSAVLVVDTTTKFIGIGIKNPAKRLHVVTVGNPAKFESTSGNGRIEIDAPSTKNAGVQFFENNVLKWGIFNQGNDVNDPLKFQNADFATRMTIQQGGNVGIGTTAPATSAILEISTTTGALLLSRMTTTQRDALTAVAGMVIFNTTTNAFNGFDGTSWNAL